MKVQIIPRDHEVKFMLKANEFRKLKAVVDNKGNAAVAGYIRSHLLAQIKKDWRELCEEIEHDSRTAEVLRCAPHGPVGKQSA